MTNRKKTKEPSKGKCDKCNEVIAKNVMTRHLALHRKEKSSSRGSSNHFHLLVEGRYNPEYWLHLEIPTSISLKKLDSFLRDIWLECCGHLSLFRIGEDNFSSSPDRDFADRSMNASLEKVIHLGMKFTHEYDFGTTTELMLKIIGEYEGERNDIQILARNVSPMMTYMKCKELATHICTECTWDEVSGLLCKIHAKQHKHDEEMFLPVVNSPRVGMCGYCG